MLGRKGIFIQRVSELFDRYAERLRKVMQKKQISSITRNTKLRAITRLADTYTSLSYNPLFYISLAEKGEDYDKPALSYVSKQVFQKTLHTVRFKRYRKRAASELASRVGIRFDYTGSQWDRGDHYSYDYLDFVLPSESIKPPYHDHGGEGLLLIRVTRKRFYAKSSQWRSSTCSETYLIGKDTPGYFRHPVSKDCKNIPEALAWIWRGYERSILERQGDVALVEGKGCSPKLHHPHRLQPFASIVEPAGVYHPKHATISVPIKGQKLIVGRRAAGKLL